MEVRFDPILAIGCGDLRTDLCCLILPHLKSSQEQSGHLQCFA